MCTSILTLALFALPVPSPAQALDATEQALVRHIEQRAPDAEALLERLCNVNSGTRNFEGVREVGAMLRAEFDGLGFETEWIDGEAWDRAGHLVARRAGTGPHVLFIGHLDTVFETDSPFQAFRRTGATTATGPGVVDMKGGDVVMLEALRALFAAGRLDALTITVVLTGDEEDSGRPLALARKALVDAATAADIALAFENGDSNPSTAVVARRGYTGWTLEVTGNASHSSQIFQPTVGAGASFELARVLFAFYDRLAGEPNLTFNPGVVLAGTDVTLDGARGSAFGKANVVARTAHAAGDLRALSLVQFESAKETMNAIVADALPGTSARLTFDDGYPPLAPTAGNRRLLALFDRASRDVGGGPVTAVDPRNAGAADVSFVAGLVDMALDGLGPGGGKDHTEEEWIELSTLPLQAKRTAVLLARLANETR